MISFFSVCKTQQKIGILSKNNKFRNLKKKGKKGLTQNLFKPVQFNKGINYHSENQE